MPADCAITAWRRWSAWSPKLGLVEAVAYHQTRMLRGGPDVRRHRGHDSRSRNVPCHPRRDCRGHPKCRETGEEKCIVFNLSGHGLCDLGSYDRYFAGELEDYEYPQERIEAALAQLPDID